MKKWPILGLVFLLTTPSYAKLVRSFDEDFSKKQLRVLVYEFNNSGYTIDKATRLLKKLYTSKEDKAYIDRIRKLVKVRLKPKLFYFPGYIELRINGKSFGKMSEIDPFHQSANINGQTISLKGKSIKKLHKEIMSAMEGHISMLDLVLPKAHAQSSAYWKTVSSLMGWAVPYTAAARQQSPYSYEGQFYQMSTEDTCKSIYKGNYRNRGSYYLLSRMFRGAGYSMPTPTDNEARVFQITFRANQPKRGFATPHSCANYWLSRRPEWNESGKANTLLMVCRLAQMSKARCEDWRENYIQQIREQRQQQQRNSASDEQTLSI